MTAKLRKDGQPKLTGGPRFKTREDDARGLNRDDHGRQAPHIPTDQTRALVAKYAITLTLPKIAKIRGCTQDTIIRYYRDEIDMAVVEAEEEIGSGLYAKAKGGHFPSIVFWLQTRAKWTRKIDIGLGGVNGGPVDIRNLDKLTDAELELLERAAEVAARMDSGESEWSTPGDPSSEGET